MKNVSRSFKNILNDFKIVCIEDFFFFFNENMEMLRVNYSNFELLLLFIIFKN